MPFSSSVPQHIDRLDVAGFNVSCDSVGGDYCDMIPVEDGTGGHRVLVAIGAYQWTPLKYACLAQCQAPLSFIQRHGGFRPDALGSRPLPLDLPLFLAMVTC